MGNIIIYIVIAILATVSFSRNNTWCDDEKIWSDAINKSPYKSRGYNELGLHLLATGNIEKSFSYLKKSLELNPYQAAVYINIGIALERIQKYDQAIEAYEKAAWMQPEDPTAHYNLGVLYYNAFKNKEKALSYFLRARDLNPYEPDVHEYLSRIYQETGNTAKALEEKTLYRRLKR